MKNKPLKILISAYACDPYCGSEEGVGWGWSRMAASMGHEVWVITDAEHRINIEKYMAENPIPGLHFQYLAKTGFFRFTEKYFQLMPLLAWRAYICWQHEAYNLGLALHQRIQFDLVHNVTYVGFRAPGFWYKMPIPFVWGPIGGLEGTNLKLAAALSMRCFFWFFCRNILNWRDKMFCRRARLGMKRAAGAIISATPEIRSEIKKYYHLDSQVISEIGIDWENRENFSSCQRNPGAPLKLIWIGKMIPVKGFPLLLKALNQLHADIKWELDVVGGGGCMTRWQAMAENFGLSAQIRWHGTKERDEVLKYLKKSHALVISSIYELTCTVAVEALVSGVPVIAPDICGFPESVPDGCGIRFNARNAGEAIATLSRAIATIYHDEAMRREMAENAFASSRKFSWQAKADHMQIIYRNAANKEAIEL